MSSSSDVLVSAKRLRVHELQLVLRKLKLKSQGRKSELLERFEQLIRDASSSKLTYYERLIKDARDKADVNNVSRITDKPQEASDKQAHSDSNPGRSKAPSPTNSTSAQKSHKQSGNDKAAQSVKLGNGFAIDALLSPARVSKQQRAGLNLKFKPLAFYDVISVVREPQSLDVLSVSTVRSQETYIPVSMSTEHLNAIQKESRFHKTLNYTEYTIQVQLRFCRIDSSGNEHEDVFPSSINVRMNDRIVPLPPLIPTNRVGVEPKRPGRPLDITEQCRLTAGSANTLQIGWAVDSTVFNSRTSHAAFDPTHAFAIFLVRKLTVDQLVERLRRSVILASETQRLVSEKLRVAHVDDSDSEAELAFASQSISVNLSCPISKTRIQLAARGRDCPHVQCFDATTYLTMNEKKPSWICPICDRSIPFERLAIDALVQSVLDAPSSQSCCTIALCSDGKWRNANDDRGTCVLSSDEDEVDEKKPNTSQPTKFPNCLPTTSATSQSAHKTPAAPNNASHPVIDLTVSDSEEDTSSVEPESAVSQVNTKGYSRSVTSGGLARPTHLNTTESVAAKSSNRKKRKSKGSTSSSSISSGTTDDSSVSSSSSATVTDDWVSNLRKRRIAARVNSAKSRDEFRPASNSTGTTQSNAASMARLANTISVPADPFSYAPHSDADFALLLEQNNDNHVELSLGSNAQFASDSRPSSRSAPQPFFSTACSTARTTTHAAGQSNHTSDTRTHSLPVAPCWSSASSDDGSPPSWWLSTRVDDQLYQRSLPSNLTGGMLPQNSLFNDQFTGTTMLLRGLQHPFSHAQQINPTHSSSLHQSDTRNGENEATHMFGTPSDGRSSVSPRN